MGFDCFGDLRCELQKRVQQWRNREGAGKRRFPSSSSVRVLERLWDMPYTLQKGADVSGVWVDHRVQDVDLGCGLGFQRSTHTMTERHLGKQRP